MRVRLRQIRPAPLHTADIVVQQPALNAHGHRLGGIARIKPWPLFNLGYAAAHRPEYLGWRYIARPRGLGLFFLLVLLAGCASAATTATPTPALGPLPTLPAEPTARPAGPAPTVAAQDEALPGRMLFVQGGNVWLWRGDAGRQLTSSGDAFQPAWSPDGRRIAYIQRVTSFSDLLVMPAEGGEPLRLTEDGPDSSVYSYERVFASTWAFYPAWSPDGATIAFASQAGPPGGSPAAEFRVSLFATPSASAGERTQLYADVGGHVGRLAYAPDGQSIAFAFGPVGTGEPTIYRYTAGSDATPFPGMPTQSYDPAWTPDGTWLAFAARKDGRTDLFAIRATGTVTDTGATPATSAGGTSPAIQLTSIGSARAPAFSPDGKQLAFLAIAPGGNSFDLWVLDLEIGADGALIPGQPRQLTQSMGLDADSGVAWGR
jgi:TolB protein